MTQTSGKYIRCSNAKSLIGMMLDVGAKMIKNETPRKPIIGRFTNAHSDAPSSVPITIAPGTICCQVRATGQP
jgi:hypothetical protein